MTKSPIKARLICLHVGNNNLVEDIKLFHEKVYIVGRSAKCDISLDLEEISNEHAKLIYNNHAWTIVDCDSSNGVFINGNNINIQKLKNGDEIQLGTALFRYQDDSRIDLTPDPSVKINYMALGLLCVVLAIISIFSFIIHNENQAEFNHFCNRAETKIRDWIHNDIKTEPNHKTARITYEELVHKKTSTLQIYYYAKNKNVLILDCPTLHQQGLMFNRVLAFVEGLGASKTELLNDQELLKFIKNKKLTFETFAFGNDFGLKNIVNFFNLANQTSTRLNKEEIRLKDILLKHNFMIVGENSKLKTTQVDKAIISITQLQADDPSSEINELIDIDIRRTVLMHELSHGDFFTNKAYRDYCKDFWLNKMSNSESKAFKTMLFENSYDINIEELCINEMQAYLMNTPDRRLFNAEWLNMTEDELRSIQQRFMSGKPPTNIY